MNTLNIDIETFSSVDLKKEGVYKYTEADDFEIILFGYKLNDGDVKVVDLVTDKTLPDEVIFHLFNPGTLKTAFNASFEITCINKFLEQNGYEKHLDVSQWEDTMLLAAYAGYGSSLKNVAEMLGLPQDKQKDRNGTLLIKKFSSPRKPTARDQRTRVLPRDDPEAWKEFKNYNRQDVIVESTIRNELKNIELPKNEKDGWVLDYKIMSSGIHIDSDLVNAALELDQTEKERLTEEIREITGIVNPKSNKQIKDWLEKKLKHELKSIGKAVVNDLIQECEETNNQDAKKVLLLRQELNKTSLAKYGALDRMKCQDERIRGMLQFYGSRTGRWAGRGVQVQNLPRNYLPNIKLARNLLINNDYELLKIIYGPNLSDIASQLIRTAFIPDENNLFAVSDYSAIEARVIAWLSGEKWRIDAFKNNQDIYCVSASQMFSVPLEKILDKDAPEHALRAQGKVAELALGYQGAAGAIAAMDFNNAIPEESRNQIVSKWRNKSPHIVQLWQLCENAAIEAIEDKTIVPVRGLLTFEYSELNNCLTIQLPSGRKLYYPDAQVGRNPFGRVAFDFLGINQTSRKIERIFMYGGKIVENCVQAIARDCLAESLLRLDKAGYRIRFHVHDEVIVDVNKDSAKEELDQIMKIMCEPPSWALDLPLNAAGFTTEFYMKD